MQNATQSKLRQFLRDELSLSPASINRALKRHPQDDSLLPILLWQEGLLSVKQLEQVFDWLVNTYLNTIPTENAA